MRRMVFEVKIRLVAVAAVGVFAIGTVGSLELTVGSDSGAAVANAPRTGNPIVDNMPRVQTARPLPMPHQLNSVGPWAQLPPKKVEARSAPDPGVLKFRSRLGLDLYRAFETMLHMLRSFI